MKTWKNVCKKFVCLFLRHDDAYVKDQEKLCEVWRRVCLRCSKRF